MKERPILFSGPMVRALLDGSKTQTRRVCKPATEANLSYVVDAPYGQWGDEDGEVLFKSPYGVIGDRLWVRESWAPDPPDIDNWGYAAWAGCRDGQIAGVPDRFRHPRHCLYAAQWTGTPIRWTPSIHMPRWASRILLEITDVRVERLQDISEADAIAEGVHGSPTAREDDDAAAFHRIGAVRGDSFPIARYGALWESINGAESWAADPWVWAVSFKRLESK